MPTPIPNLPFVEALKYWAQKEIMPTSMSSEELMSLGADIRERSLFSARTTMESYLENIEEQVRKILRAESAPASEVASGDLASARLNLRNALDKLGYDPGARADGIQDLSSDARINLVVQTNRDMAHGYGTWRQGQDPVVLDEWPAQRLYRLEDRIEKRDWVGRAQEAVGQTGDHIIIDGEGFVALKNAAIWEAISAFGQPYPPFDFNSGMWVEDVSREDAVEMGLISEDQQIPPQIRPFESAA